MTSGDASPIQDQDDLRERLISAALQLIADHGLSELTVRRLADAADTSTMSVYSRFGSRVGVLKALYARAYDLLAEALAAVPNTADPVADLLVLARAYRTFALARPNRYSFMFDQAGFQPDEPLRARSFQSALDPVVAVVRRAVPDGVGTLRTAYCLWSVMHGLLGLELAKVPGTALPEVDFQPDDRTAEQMYLAGCTAMLIGLGLLRV
jgi:AcrR family transcriptional regulator